jgi:6,7-dimethyl-8-ribityllumazine synthase
MPKTEARLPSGARVAAVASGYHGELVRPMLESARRELFAAGLAPEDFLVVDAPGAFELPVIARRLAQREDVDAVLCLGLVLKGETRHDEYIASSVAHALQEVALATGCPVLFGVLTCDTYEQARSRALPPEQGGQEDKGREVARAAIEVLAALERAASIGPAGEAVGFQSRPEPRP